MRRPFAILLWFPLLCFAIEVPAELKGKWHNVTKSEYDVLVTDSTLVFDSTQGAPSVQYTFLVIGEDTDAVVLELSNVFRCGKFVRLGPMHIKKHSTGMQVSVYETKEKALSVPPPATETSRIHERRAFCSWTIWGR